MSYTISEFERIYTCNVERCMALAISLLGSEDDARDVVQDVFVKLWESNAKIINPQAFVVRSVRNACLDRLKSVSVRDRVRMELPIEPTTSDDNDVKLRNAELLAAVDTLLSDRDKSIVDLVYGQGKSYKETAQSLGVSVSLVNKCLVKALKTLRQHFNVHKL